jgi:hypothetical protein
VTIAAFPSRSPISLRLLWFVKSAPEATGNAEILVSRPVSR